MKKNIITFILVGITVLSIYGCGNKGKEIVEFLKAIEATLEESEETYRTPEQTEIQQPETEQKQWQVYIQPDMPEPFIEVLKQYEDFMNTDIQILNDDAWWYEFSKVDGERGYLYDELCASLMDSLLQASVKERESEPFRYSLTDLTGDGFPELIMGYYSNYDGETWLYIIYYYSEIEGVKIEHMSRYYTMVLYEGGIIGYYSAGAGDHSITYLQFQEETESWERVACIAVYYDPRSDSERYYWGENLANFLDNASMSEEEYQEIIERYTAEPVELEWTPMFCGETPEDEAESKTNESITVIAKVTHYFAYESDIYWTEYEYDNVGNEIKETSYSHDGSIDYWYESEYDNAGNRVKHICHGADGDISYWEEYEYDGAGNKMKSISYYADKGINGRNEYAYDSAGNRVKWIHYNADDSIFATEEYEYDSTGNLTKTIGYNGHRDITRRIEYEYDNVGNLLGWIQYNGYDNDYDIRAKYEYNSAGKQTEFMSYDIEGNVVDKYEYKYDSKGNLTEEVNCGNNSSTYFRTEYEYDSTGNLTKMTEYYLSHRIEYEYITITPQ